MSGDVFFGAEIMYVGNGNALDVYADTGLV